jgi:hypothetical protein
VATGRWTQNTFSCWSHSSVLHILLQSQKKTCGQKLNAWFTQRLAFPENGWQPEVYNRRSSFSRAKSDSSDHEACPASGQTCSGKPAEGSDWKWGIPESNRSDYHISQIRGVYGFRVHHKLRRGKMLKDVKWAWSLDATKSWAAVSWLKKHPNPCLSDRTHNVRMFQALLGHYSVVLLKRQGMSPSTWRDKRYTAATPSRTWVSPDHNLSFALRCPVAVLLLIDALCQDHLCSFPVLVTMSKNCAKCGIQWYTLNVQSAVYTMYDSYGWYGWLLKACCIANIKMAKEFFLCQDHLFWEPFPFLDASNSELILVTISIFSISISRLQRWKKNNANASPLSKWSEPFHFKDAVPALWI